MIDDPRSDYADGTYQDQLDAYDAYLGIPAVEDCGDRAECHDESVDYCVIHRPRLVGLEAAALEVGDEISWGGPSGRARTGLVRAVRTRTTYILLTVTDLDGSNPRLVNVGGGASYAFPFVHRVAWTV